MPPVSDMLNFIIFRERVWARAWGGGQAREKRERASEREGKRESERAISFVETVLELPAFEKYKAKDLDKNGGTMASEHALILKLTC